MPTINLMPQQNTQVTGRQTKHELVSIRLYPETNKGSIFNVTTDAFAMAFTIICTLLFYIEIS